jgi:selenium-binding protein 1
MSRKYLLVPGVRSNNIHVVDTATDPRAPRLHKVIDGAEIKSKTDLSGPHTVHCLGSEIIISMLGDAKGEAPGGYLHLNKDFDILGRWENSMGDIPFRLRLLVPAAPQRDGQLRMGRAQHVHAGLRPRRSRAPEIRARIAHFWDFEKRATGRDILSGRGRAYASGGEVPPRSRQHPRLLWRGAVANVIHWWKDDAGKWQWEKIIDVENEPHPEWPIPVPGVMSAILISMDDKYLYLNNWLHGDMRQYDITDPHNPVLTGQVWMGGLLGKAPEVNGIKVAGGPQMFQLSLDGRRLYVTTSLFSTWDNQFYPEIRERRAGSW